MPTNKLPDGWRIEREPHRTGVEFSIYRDGYVWPPPNHDKPRAYHVVELWWPDEWTPETRISVASSSDKSVELATCICTALAAAIAEADSGEPDPKYRRSERQRPGASDADNEDPPEVPYAS